MGLQPITNFLKPIKSENDNLNNMPIVKSISNSVMKHNNKNNIITNKDKNNTNKLNITLDK